MRTRSKRARKCPICRLPMRKNGHDRNGRQRWQCDACRATTTATTRSRNREAVLRLFLDWLPEASPQRRLECDACTFRRRSAWCWDLSPRIIPDCVVHHVVMTDGTYMNGWCLPAAIDGISGDVLAWQWCARESTAAYNALFAQIALPDVLVCDGMKGIQRACAESWPGTRIQRCLIHIQRDTRQDLTCRPRLEAGRELKRLADALTRIHDADHAAHWGEAPDAWRERWRHMLAERTFAREHPDGPRAATSRSDWWWTHLRLRRAYFRLERLFRDGSLFCFLEPELQAYGPVPRDGNRLEGGLNAAIKRMLVDHRGMPEKHMRRACEWPCYMRSAKPDPARILKEHDRQAGTDAAHDAGGQMHDMERVDDLDRRGQHAGGGLLPSGERCLCSLSCGRQGVVHKSWTALSLFLIMP